MTKKEIEKAFYSLVKDAQNGITLSLTEDSYDYIRFNYFENDTLINKEMTDEDYLGSIDATEEEYDAEFSNGTANYLPTLKVNNKELFFDHLYLVVLKYIEFYKMDKAIEKIGEFSIIKTIIKTIFSNARYDDYENPIQYLKKYINFFNDETLSTCHNTEITSEIPILENGSIIVNNLKDDYGYETPYAFSISIKRENEEYFLPIINYGISDNVCYIYSIQNKRKNEENNFNKKIKRILNKINAGVENDTDYERNDTILGTTPSFILALAIFSEILNRHNINEIRVVTFLPDRYMEKKATEEYDADEIQRNLTEKLVLLFYRLKHHFPDIEINFPIYDGYSINIDNIGSDLIIRTSKTFSCDNNQLLNEIISSMNEEKINDIQHQIR